MPPRINMWGAFRGLSIRSRPVVQTHQPRVAAPVRKYADDATPPPPATSDPYDPKHKWGPSEDGKIMRSSFDPENEADPLAVVRTPAVTMVQPSAKDHALSQLELTALGLNPFDVAFTGHKFELPELPIPGKMHMKYRYEPVIQQLTRLLMRDGKLSKAQSDMAMVLNYLRTSPPPKINPQRPLLPGSPPPHHLPLNPTLYLTLAIDSVAPLIRMRGFANLAGGGKALEVPVPMAARQRRRTAFMWIMDTVNKKPSKGSGRTMLAHRIGEEIVAVIEGRSSVWGRRDVLHKQGTSNRANLNSPALLKAKTRL